MTTKHSVIPKIRKVRAAVQKGELNLDVSKAPEVMTISEVAALFDVSPSSVSWGLHYWNIPHRRLSDRDGSPILISRTALDEWLRGSFYVREHRGSWPNRHWVWREIE